MSARELCPPDTAELSLPKVYECYVVRWRGGHAFFLYCSSTMRYSVPGGNTCSVFKNSISAFCSYVSSAVNA